MPGVNHADLLRAELDSTRRRLCSHGVPFANCADHPPETTPETGEDGASTAPTLTAGSSASDHAPTREEPTE